MFCVPNQFKLFFDNRRSSEEVLIEKACLLNKLQVNFKFSRIKEKYLENLCKEYRVCHKKPTSFLFINN